MVLKQNKVLALIIALFLYSGMMQAQEVENEFKSRASVELNYSPIKKLRLVFSPEFRYDETFTLEKYHFEFQTTYKLSKVLSAGATYRFVINPRETKETQYISRYAFHATYKKSYGDFDPSFRICYSNYADDNGLEDNYLRFKAKLKYDIPKSKLTPLISAEAFRNQTSDDLYKMRYTLGADYKLFKKNYVGVSYKFDYFLNEYKNSHIVSIGYKFKF